MMNIPKVSVIIPVYGVEEYIERCVRSLFEQTLDSIEYLFIDDCTPDCSIGVLKKTLEDYPDRKDQVIIHSMEKNSGQAAVREWGMKHVKGEYVIHCDSDDWVDVNMYKRMYNKAKECNYDIVRCNFVRTDGMKESMCDIIPESCYAHTDQLLSKALIGQSLTSLCDKLVNRRILTNIIYPVNNMYEDTVLVIQMLYYAKKVAYIPKPFYKYFYSPNSICNRTCIESYLDRLNQVCANTNLIVKFLLSKDILDLYSDEVEVLKYRAKSHIVDLIGIKKYYKLWESKYPEINYHIFFNKKMRWQDKIKYGLELCRIFGLFNK